MKIIVIDEMSPFRQEQLRQVLTSAVNGYHKDLFGVRHDCEISFGSEKQEAVAPTEDAPPIESDMPPLVAGKPVKEKAPKNRVKKAE
ncbi:MAG: hypothetical protein P4N59_03320 [Negativicutes bacterium]|nr:hypothetical protein [Negativicutes bacterium]